VATSSGIETAALLAGALALSGCHRYVAVSPGTVAPDAEVRVRITQEAAGRLAGQLGTYATELDGTLAPQGPDSLTLKVPIVRQYRGVRLDSAVQVLSLGRSDVVDVRRSRFARGRTIVAGAGVLVGFALLAAAIIQLTDPNPGSDGSPPPPPPP
jgi:hypothetical protein